MTYPFYRPTVDILVMRVSLHVCVSVNSLYFCLLRAYVITSLNILNKFSTLFSASRLTS